MIIVILAATRHSESPLHSSHLVIDKVIALPHRIKAPKNSTTQQQHITMSFLTRSIPRALRTTPIRTFTTSRPLAQELKRGPDMGSNKPDASANSSAKPNADARSSPLNTDQQSSASSEEHKSGSDHPAKQPDQQAQPTRTTGIGGGEEVKGGKEGQGEISESGKKNLAGQ